MKRKAHLALLLCIGLPIFAQTFSYNQAKLLNDYFFYNTTSSDVSYLYDNKFVVCWVGESPDKSEVNIYCKICNTTASEESSEIKVNTSLLGNTRTFPSISNLSDDGFVVCWSHSNNGLLTGIYGQVFNGNGSKRGDEFFLSSQTSSYHANVPDVTNLTEGGFVTSWTYGPYSGAQNLNICYQIFNSDVSKRGDKFTVEIDNIYQYNPSVCNLKNEQFVICWQSQNSDDNSGIVYQIFDNDGAKSSSQFHVNSNSFYKNSNPSIICLKDGHFVIWWQRLHQDRNHWGVFGQIYKNDGSPIGDEIKIDTDIFLDQRVPTVCSLSDSGFVICWSSGYKIGCQLFDKNGKKRGHEFCVNLGFQLYEALSVSDLGNNGFVVVWVGPDKNYGNSFGIYGKYYLNNELNHQLVPFSLLEPANDAIIKSIETSLKWQIPSFMHINLPWELEYHIYIDENEGFSSPKIIDTIYDTLYTITDLSPNNTYFWKILAKNIEGDSIWSSQTNGFYVSQDAVSIDIDRDKFPKSFVLLQNYPNPFNPTTTITYEIPKEVTVELSVNNINGKLVKTLVKSRMSAGKYNVIWDASKVSSGIYIYQLKAGDFIYQKKCVFLR